MLLRVMTKPRTVTIYMYRGYEDILRQNEYGYKECWHIEHQVSNITFIIYIGPQICPSSWEISLWEHLLSQI